MKETILFILCFLAINFLVFVPYWLIGVFSKIDSSKKPFFKGRPYIVFKKILFYRETDDCIRLIFELQLVTLIWLLLGDIFTPFVKYLLLVIILISFIYKFYITVILKVFKKSPTFSNDYNFAKTGITLYRKKLPLIIVSIVLLLLTVVLISNFLIDVLISNFQELRFKWIITTVLFLSVVLSVISMYKILYSHYHNCVSFSLVKHIYFNIKKTVFLGKSLKQLNHTSPYKFTDSLGLKSKPNIILIFLESYGSYTLSSDKDFGLRENIEKLSQTLGDNQWKTLSAFSHAPVSSGGSWLSHSSIFFGAKVGDIVAHELIFSHNDFAQKLISLPNILKERGYKTTMTSTISFENMNMNWEKIKNAYPFDNLMLYNDFNYKGKKINIFGHSVTPPDGYTLNYAYEKHKENAPFFLCLSTTNSHFNFVSPIKTFHDWKDYNTKDFELTDGHKKNILPNYFKSISYQFDYLNTFFKTNDLDDTIVVLIGDHQPPFITPSDADRTTPIHIISKNQDFIKEFEQFDFTEGFYPKIQNTKVKHESFFSKFMYAINKAYGKDKNAEFPIFDDGIPLY